MRVMPRHQEIFALEKDKADSPKPDASPATCAVYEKGAAKNVGGRDVEPVVSVEHAIRSDLRSGGVLSLVAGTIGFFRGAKHHRHHRRQHWHCHAGDILGQPMAG